MKFDRLTLIAHIDELEAEAQEAHEQAYQERLARWNTAVGAWKKDQAPHLLSQLRSLVDQVRKGKVLLKSEATSALFGKDCFLFTGVPEDEHRWRCITEKPEPTPFIPNKELAGLRAVLTLAAEDEVTSTFLSQAGFRPQKFLKAMS